MSVTYFAESATASFSPCLNRVGVMIINNVIFSDIFHDNNIYHDRDHVQKVHAAYDDGVGVHSVRL